MDLRRSYTLLAPIYDAIVNRPLRGPRQQSLGWLPQDGCHDILIAGIGTGLDVPFLPHGHRYLGIDLTRAMLARAKHRGDKHDLTLVQGDCMRLPFPDARFDHAILHLILAVVPDAVRCLSEAARVTRPGGNILILDKFLMRGERAWLRRSINPLARRIATRTDVILENVLERVPQVQVIENRGVLAGGWFRILRLVR